MPKTKIGIRVEIDPDFLVTDDWSDSEDLREETKQKIANDEWSPYMLVALVNGSPDYRYGLSGSVVAGFHEGDYERPEEIKDEHLREEAKRIIDEATAGIEIQSWFVVAKSPAGARWAYEAALKDPTSKAFDAWEEVGAAADRQKKLNADLPADGTRYNVYSFEIAVREL
ncbi:hypothetical protein GCM10010331_44480 [Streptomyces xanthochromogenes]|uniref:hypothetical protein n=1 Tax=Streptomyces xanthochromogenes TaxID=67384 RepID=UPI00167BE75B|nr:hypothetical protein [Streptomyces xanthochromogenes]GHB52027.1 hypothetical protein GCM10010331_44480 [Streptomyces xanthochromogenes]